MNESLHKHQCTKLNCFPNKWKWTFGTLKCNWYGHFVPLTEYRVCEFYTIFGCCIYLRLKYVTKPAALKKMEFEQRRLIPPFVQLEQLPQAFFISVSSSHGFNSQLQIQLRRHHTKCSSLLQFKPLIPRKLDGSTGQDPIAT